MAKAAKSVGGLFGQSRSDRLAELLRSLSAAAISCADCFRNSAGQDLNGIIDWEHKADAIVDDIHELLDNSFIMRFDIPDSMRLADDLDDVVDGMRKVALHADAYRPLLPSLDADAMKLFAIGEGMLKRIDELIAMLAEPRLSLARVRDVANIIDEAESEADQMVAALEKTLIQQYAAPGANAIGFIASHQLYHLLEQMTDDANHCAKMILSLARKEA
jgi:uncharacterized protein